MSAEDNILAGITGFTEGVKDVYVPYQQNRQKYQLQNQLDIAKSQRDLANEKALVSYKAPYEAQKLQTEYGLKGQQESSKFNQEGYLNYGDLTPDLAAKIGMTPGTRIRKETLAPYTGLLGKEETNAAKASAKNDVNTKKITEEIALLQGTLSNYDNLLNTYKQAKGDSGAVGGTAKSLVSSMTRGEIFPTSKVYNDHVGEFMNTANKQLTGVGPRTQEAIRAAIQSVPQIGESNESATAKAERFRGLITDRIGKLQGLIQTSGASALTPYSQGSPLDAVDSSNYQNTSQGSSADALHDSIMASLKKKGK